MNAPAASRKVATRGQLPLELIEDAARLLRTAPPRVLLSYYLGCIPGLLGLLYFFGDVVHGAFAGTRLVESSLGIAALYLWMKCWQTVFAAGLHSIVADAPPSAWSLSRIARLVAAQAALQPTGLFLRIIAAQCVLPYVWVYSFYQNVTVLGDGRPVRMREVVDEAVAQAKLWPGQTHGALAILFLFAFFIWLNVAVTFVLAPQALKMFFGVETVFSRSPGAMLNTTVFAASLAVTYLCFDPLRKALYVLRCFHGTSRRSGEDLQVELKSFRAKRPARVSLMMLLLVASLAAGTATRAAETVPPASRVDAAQLDQSLDKVLQRREFVWRMPRAETVAAEKGWVTQFFESVLRSVRRAVRQVSDWVVDFIDWLGRVLFGRGSSGDSAGGVLGSVTATQVILWSLVIAGVVALGFWLLRAGPRKLVVAAQAVTAIPDLASESVVADQLPEDGWLQVAQELMQRGELRLALRASYLGALAHLGRRELITIARHKTNFDYDRELHRRARSREELLTAFEENLRAFERCWYGRHEVTAETLGGFHHNLEKIRAC